MSEPSPFTREYDELYRRLARLPTFDVSTLAIGRGQVLVSISRRDKGGDLRAINVKTAGLSVQATITDADATVIADTLMQCLYGLHFKVGKGYLRGDHLDYYLRPDWTYWYAQAGFAEARRGKG